MKWTFAIISTTYLISMGYVSDIFADELKLKIVFQNPSENVEKKEEARHYLPAELRKDDIVNTGGLVLDYDPSASLYYLHTNVVLAPKQSVTYTAVVNDVWKIPQEELDFLKNQTDQQFISLEGKESYDNAKLLYDKVMKNLSEITTTQQEQMTDVEKRIESFRVNTQRIKTIRSYIILLKDFEQEAEIESDNIKKPREIKYVIKARNPSSAKPMSQDVVRYFPNGILPDLITDKQGFDVKFDVEKKLYYLSQKVNLAAGETKVFQVTISDRWHVREDKLDNFQTHGQELTDFLANSEFKNASVYLMNEIKKYVKEIKTSQSAEVTIVDRIGNYAENIKKVEAVKLDIAELERMAQILRERTRIKTLEELLKKLRPSTIILWRIIYGTITFLFIVSALTYFLWWGKTKKKQGKEYDQIGGTK